jgi:hypothetical protein
MKREGTKKIILCARYLRQIGKNDPARSSVFTFSFEVTYDSQDNENKLPTGLDSAGMVFMRLVHQKVEYLQMQLLLHADGSGGNNVTGR